MRLRATSSAIATGSMATSSRADCAMGIIRDKQSCGAVAPRRSRRRFSSGGVQSVDGLVHIVTTMIFIATAEHSSTNNGQYDMYAFIPNVPGAIFAAPPTTKAPLSEQSLFDSLPRPRTAAKQIGMVH